MISSKYMEKIEQIKHKYITRNFHSIDSTNETRVSCNICLKQEPSEPRKNFICFIFYDKTSTTYEYCHESCIQDLLNPNLFNLFKQEYDEKLRRLKLKIKGWRN